jgi:hypothetical protein
MVPTYYPFEHRILLKLGFTAKEPVGLSRITTQDILFLQQDDTSPLFDCRQGRQQATPAAHDHNIGLEAFRLLGSGWTHRYKTPLFSVF